MAKRKRRRRPTADSIGQLLSQQHSTELLALLGITTTDHRPLPTKLGPEVIDPDCLWAVIGGRAVQLENQTDLPADMHLRLLEYRVRIWRRKEPKVTWLDQYVLVLRDGSPPGMLACTDPICEVEVDYHGTPITYTALLVRNFDPEVLLANPVSAVLAPLARCESIEGRVDLVRRACDVIRASGRPNTEQLIAWLMALAGLRIGDPTMIEAVITEENDDMPIDLRGSSTVAPLLQEAEARGEARGVARGIRGMLRMRFGDDPAITDDLIDRLARHPDPETLIRNAKNVDRL